MRCVWVEFGISKSIQRLELLVAIVYRYLTAMRATTQASLLESLFQHMMPSVFSS